MATSSGLAPVIGPAGISAGTYQQWLAYFTAQYQSIFGADAYLGNDSQDGQLLQVFALACSDCCASAIAAYNAFSPATAQGAGLSSVVKINGLARLVPTNSTVLVTIGGVANTVITNGSVVDSNNVIWNLPATVVIPSGGSVTVTATCSVLGAVTAIVGAITGIQTPSLGWQTVINPAAAIPGAPVETDAALRVRQTLSVAQPSVTVFSGIVASIKALAGVTRVRGIENNTNATNGFGIPARTLDFVVEGGTQAAIWAAIAAKITPGVPTYGSNTTTLTDANGSTRLINYETAVPANFTIVISLKALAGWSVTTEPVIQAALIAYLTSLPIGALVSMFSGIVPTAGLIGTIYASTFNLLGITLQKGSGSVVSTDVQLNYNEAALTSTGNITFVVS